MWLKNSLRRSKLLNIFSNWKTFQYKLHFYLFSVVVSLCCSLEPIQIHKRIENCIFLIIDKLLQDTIHWWNLILQFYNWSQILLKYLWLDLFNIFKFIHFSVGRILVSSSDVSSSSFSIHYFIFNSFINNSDSNIIGNR